MCCNQAGLEETMPMATGGAGRARQRCTVKSPQSNFKIAWRIQPPRERSHWPSAVAPRGSLCHSHHGVPLRGRLGTPRNSRSFNFGVIQHVKSHRTWTGLHGTLELSCRPRIHRNERCRGCPTQLAGTGHPVDDRAARSNRKMPH